MHHRVVPLKLAPAGLVVDCHEIGADGIIVQAHGASPTSACPACGLASSSVHSRYGRCFGDLPAHGRRLKIRLEARRFRCRNAACERRVFTERLAPDLIQVHAPRTSRLDVLTYMVVLALGGRPGERLASAERFIRTLKENLLWVQTFDTLEELRQALLAFKDTYNTIWLIGRLGHRTPAAVRRDLLSPAALAA